MIRRIKSSEVAGVRVRSSEGQKGQIVGVGRSAGQKIGRSDGGVGKQGGSEA